MAKYSRKQNSWQEEVSRPEKKMSKGVLILFIILGVFIIPAASFVTGIFVHTDTMFATSSSSICKLSFISFFS